VQSALPARSETGNPKGGTRSRKGERCGDLLAEHYSSCGRVTIFLGGETGSGKERVRRGVESARGRGRATGPGGWSFFPPCGVRNILEKLRDDERLTVKEKDRHRAVERERGGRAKGTGEILKSFQRGWPLGFE